MKIRFFKYQGTGNDFILIDNRGLHISLNTEQVRHLCDRRFGIGADGLMMLQSEPGFDFRMIYFNSDGNEGSMCGNGGRCITSFATRLGIHEKKYRFIAVDGVHEAVIEENGEVSLKMQDVMEVEINQDYYYLNTGSPHYVTSVDHLNELDVFSEGRKIRYNDRFREHGTNVNFIEKLEDGLHVRTYERGVENETYSCGTGVTACGLVAALKGWADNKHMCKVKTPGGDLEVKFDRVLDKSFYNIWLKGMAEFVFEGEIELKS